MFMHSFSNRVTLDRNKVYGDSELPPTIKYEYVTPNAGVGGDKVSSYEPSSDDDGDVDDAVTQAQVEELSSADDFVTPKKRKASDVSRSIELLEDSDSE